MKVAISIPEATLVKAEALARRWNTSRSAAFVKVMDAFDDKPSPSEITEAANRFADEMTNEMRQEQDMWLRAGARTVLKHTEW